MPRRKLRIAAIAIAILAGACHEPRDPGALNEVLERYGASMLLDQPVEEMKRRAPNASYREGGSNGFFVDSLKNPRGFTAVYALEFDEPLRARLSARFEREPEPQSTIAVIRLVAATQLDTANVVAEVSRLLGREPERVCSAKGVGTYFLWQFSRRRGIVFAARNVRGELLPSITAFVDGDKGWLNQLRAGSPPTKCPR